MAEQRVDLCDVRAKGDVNVSPTQIIHGVTGAGVRGWTEALVQGPLEHAGLADCEAEARRLEEAGSPCEAAELLQEVAEGLVDQGYEPAAEQFLTRASRLLETGGATQQARKLYLRVARARLGDGSLQALSHARRARELSDDDERWEPEALLAVASWPERQHGDTDALRTALRKANAGEQELQWAAALVQHLRSIDEDDEARKVAACMREGHPLAVGDRLELELDYLDLVPPAEQDREWMVVVAWLADPRLPVHATGMAWQRRGVMLARRGDAEAARTAFLQAVVAHWAREPGYDDQAAAAYFSALSACSALGDLSAGADSARGLAHSLRGVRPTYTSRTERLLRRGLRELVHGGNRMPDAYRFLATAVEQARRAGNLADFFEASEALGDCLQQADQARAALTCYISAGLSKQAKELGALFSVDTLLSGVALDGPDWERTATWAALAGAGRSVSDQAAEQLAEAAFAEEERASARNWPTNAAYFGLEVLANIVCALPNELRLRALVLLRERLEFGMGDPGRLADPLIAVTLAGLSDETPVLVGALLGGNVRMNLRGSQLGDVLEFHPRERQRLEEAALAGHGGAVEALVFAEAGLEEGSLLADKACGVVQAAIAAPLREERVEGNVRTVSYGMGASIAPEGLMARSCPAEVRHRFVDKLLLIFSDEELPLMNRVGAVEALHNLAPALDEYRLDELIEVLGRLAASPDVLTRFDRLDHDEPLARFKVNMAPPNALRATAIEALGVIAQCHPVALQPLPGALAAALASGSERLIVAALHALARHPDQASSEVNVAGLVLAPWPSVRVAALGALERQHPDSVLNVAAQMTADPSDYVRRQLISLAMRRADEQLLATLGQDPDCFVRAMARRELDELKVEERR